MPKMKFKDFKEIGNEVGTFDTARFLENKYFGLFLNAYKFPTLNAETQRFLLKKLWNNGCAAIFIIEGTRKEPTLNQALTNNSPNTIATNNPEDNGLPCVVPFAVAQWNIYDEPSVINLINVRGAKYIPTSMQVVNRDACIIWAHKSHAPIRMLAKYYIDQMVEVQKTIDMNLFIHKMPRLVVCSPEDEARVKEFMEKIERGEKNLFLTSDDAQAIKNVLDSGASGSYIIDKLKQFMQILDNELLTFLGINNVPVEKAERLITDEAKSNDQLIVACANCFLDSLKESCENVEKVLKYPMPIEATSTPQVEDMEEEDAEDDNEDEPGGEDDAQ